MNDADRPPLDPYATDVTADPYLEWDAGYVLGALSPAERREFEGHLSGCAACQAAVAEIAGMPGLLAQLSPEDVGDDAVDPGSVAQPRRAVAPGPAVREVATPDSLVPRLVRLDRQRRRLTRGMVALAAAFVLLATLVGVAGIRGSFDLSRPSADAPVRLAFSPVVPTDITAVVDVVPVASGTELRVECQYASADPSPSYTGKEYAIVVTDTSGHTMSVKTWTVRANKVMHPSGLSPLPKSKISSVEIRAADSSQALLRAQLN